MGPEISSKNIALATWVLSQFLGQTLPVLGQFPLFLIPLLPHTPRAKLMPTFGIKKVSFPERFFLTHQSVGSVYPQYPVPKHLSQL